MEEYPDIEKEYHIQKKEKENIFIMIGIINDENRKLSGNYMDQLKEEGYTCVLDENLE